MSITPGEWKYGTREDGSMWLSLGNPHFGPHYQGDLVASKGDADLIISARELLEALKDERSEAAALAGPCQAGFIPKCVCSKCRLRRSHAAIQKAEGRK